MGPPNERAPGKGGIPSLLHAGRARPALPEHNRSAHSFNVFRALPIPSVSPVKSVSIRVHPWLSPFWLWPFLIRGSNAFVPRAFALRSLCFFAAIPAPMFEHLFSTIFTPQNPDC